MFVKSLRGTLKHSVFHGNLLVKRKYDNIAKAVMEDPMYFYDTIFAIEPLSQNCRLLMASLIENKINQVFVFFCLWRKVSSVLCTVYDVF